jgi:hypothetical protein
MSALRIVLGSVPFSEHPIGEVLNVGPGDIAEPCPAEFVRDVKPRRCVIASQRGGLVAIA